MLISSHTTNHNNMRLPLRFWNNCARMLSVIVVSAAVTGGVYASTITAGADNAPEVAATFSSTPYSTARIAGIDAQTLQLPFPSNVNNTAYYGVSSLVTNHGAISGALPIAATLTASNAVTTRTFGYLPNPGFYGTDSFTYNIWDSSSVPSNGTAPNATGTITITVSPSLIETPDTGTTTTIDALTGSGVTVVNGLGTVDLSNIGSHTAPDGIIVDGGNLKIDSAFSNSNTTANSIPLAARHGATVTSTANIKFSKIILG